MLQLARPGTARPGPDRIVVALFDARSVAHMPAITFTNLYILYLLWHYQWQDCAAGSEQRAAALLTCCLPSLLPPSSNLLSPPSPFLLSHFVAHTSLPLPVPEPQSAMTLHRQNCMLIASSQLQTKPASPAPPHEAGPRPTSFKYPLKSEIYALALCKRRLRITARPEPEPETESQNHRPAQVSTREATPNIYFEVGKIIAGSWRR